MRLSKLIAVVFFYNLPYLQAAEIDYGIGLQLGSYENIQRTEISPGNEYSETLLAYLSWNLNTVDIIGSVYLQSELTNYRNNIEEDRNQVDLNADITWIISPNHYLWKFSNILTHTAIDPTLSDTPANRQYVNSLSTGPDFIWRFGKIDQILISPRVEDYKFEDDTLNNYRFNNVIEWIHKPSKSISYGLDNKLEHTQYTASNLSDRNYQQIDINAILTYIKNKNSIEGKIGLTKIESDSFETENNTQYSLSFTQQRTSTSSFELEGSKTVTDTSRSISTVTIDDIDILTTSSDLFINKSISFIYNKKIRNTDLTLNFANNKEDYFNQNDLDREINSARLNLRWFNTSNTNFLISLRSNNIDYTDTLNTRKDDDLNSSLTYQYKTNRNLSYSLSLSKLERQSNIATESFEDKIILFSIIYSTNNRYI